MDLSELSVVIPAFNEEESIGDTLRELREHCPEVEIVVVDDGSTDRTATIVAELEGVRLVSHHRNRGYGDALKTGIRHSTGRFVAWYDADRQHRPVDLVAVAKPVIAG